jgi:hypothetical protein
MEEVHACTNSNKISRDVERIGNDEHPDEYADDTAPRAAESHDHELAEPFAGRERRPIADLLHGSHQGEGDERHPKHPKAKLGAGLRIRGDAGGIVVRSSRDQARPERA